MEFIKISIAALKFPMSLKKAIFLYYLKKLFTIRHSETDKNMKRLILSIMAAKGEIKSYDHRNTEVTIDVADKLIQLPLRHAPYSDVGILNEFIVLDEYEELFAQSKRSFENHQNINIIDAGSNIGLFTVYAKAHFPNAKIFMIEPDHEGIAQFMKIAKTLNLNSIEIYNNGLLDQSGIEINISNGPRADGNASFVVTKSSAKSTLKSINLNEIVLNKKLDVIHILKIDIEGSEEDVILGKNFDWELAQKIVYIAIEIHDDMVNRSSIEERLQSLNFDKLVNGRVDIFGNKHYTKNQVS